MMKGIAPKRRVAPSPRRFAKRSERKTDESESVDAFRRRETRFDY